VDDDTQRDLTDPRYPDPHEVLHRALFDAQLERDQLGRAIQSNDAERAVIAATEAYKSWLNAKAACLRIKAREVAIRERSRQAERAVHLSFASLRDQITNALSELDGIFPRHTLEQLKGCLSVAHDDPVVEEGAVGLDAAPRGQRADERRNGTSDS